MSEELNNAPEAGLPKPVTLTYAEAQTLAAQGVFEKAGWRFVASGDALPPGSIYGLSVRVEPIED